jgi:hypothetical protein
MISNTIASLAGLALVAAMTTNALASSQRTFVGTTGTDNPNCSLAAPCRTFAAAITAASAGGEVVVLDSGGYGGATIAKSISIIAPPGICAGISVGSGDGITINGSAVVVSLRGLAINGQGGTNGVHITNAAKVEIDSCTISDFVGAGILHQSGKLYVRDSIVRNNTSIGIWSIGTPLAQLDRVKSEGNLDGVRAQDGATVVVDDSVLSDNVDVAAFAFGSTGFTTTTMSVSHSVMSFNQQGVQARSVTFLANVYVNVSDSTVSDNVDGLLTTQDAGGFVGIEAFRNTITQSTTVDIHVTASTYMEVDGNHIGSIAVDAGGTISTRDNNRFSSYSNNGTITHASPF